MPVNSTKMVRDKTMLRISKIADYGTKVLLMMALEPVRIFAASELAEMTKVPLPTVSKILKILSKSGLLRSQRGSQGGYQLAVSPDTISLAKIVGILDGDIAMTNCEGGCCELAANCNTRDNWLTITQLIQDILKNISLQQMLQPIRGAEMPVKFYSKATS